MPVKAVVLAQPPEAGGKTPLDRMRPVELLPVANRPILFHGLETMAAAGIRDVAIVVTPQTEGPIREAIGHGASWGVDVSYLAAKRSRGLAGLLLEAEDFLDGQPFILQQGSGLLQDDLGPLVNGLADDAPDALLLVHRWQGRPAPAGTPARPRAARAGGRPRARPGHGRGRRPALRSRVHGACACTSQRAPRRPQRGCAHRRAVPRRRTRRGAARRGLAALRGRPARSAGAQPHAARPVAGRVRGRRPEDADRGARLDPSFGAYRGDHIRGPAIIGAEARIVDSFIGPYTAIGECAQVEGSEIEHSIVLSGAAILHLGGRLEGSVVGRGARVVRDFSVPRGLRLHVGDDARVILR